MGKSSLMVRTARRLKQQGVRTAIIDLTTMGGKTEETWYLDFLTELSDQLNVEQEVEAWWQERATLGAVRRFSNFLRDVVLEKIDDQIVIFVDEIDFTLGLPFADDFFAAVRATYNARALDPKFNRLTFIFLGVAAPADLIKDRTRTPFNIGEGIMLRDFDRTVAAVLQQGLEATYPGQGQTILDRIFYWTAGHPYLTQKLCHEVVEAKHAGPWTEAEVDRVVHDLFLSDQTNREQNLQFVQDRVLKNPYRRELLKLYGKVRAGKAIANDEQSVLQNQLKLAGLVTTDDGNLRVHNEIYRVVFDAKWIKANTPRDSNRLVVYAAVALAVLVVGLAGFVLLRNSYVQQQSDQLQLEFTQVGTPAERLDRLAQLFELQGILNTANYDDAARRLFFDMNSRQDQLALFKVQDPRVIGVIQGLYTTLADVDRRSDNDELLRAMRDAPQGTPQLYKEIDHWLKAREFFRKSQYSEAEAEYDSALDTNNNNPATHFELAQTILIQPTPVYSRTLSELDAVIAAASKVLGPGESGSEETATPIPTEVPVAASASSPTQVTSGLTPSPGAPVSTAAAATNVATTPAKPTISTTATPTTSLPGPTVIGPTSPLPPDAGQRPFRSQFITFVQIASAVRRLIDSSSGLVAFLANSAESDYGNLRVANLVRTLTPTVSTTQLTPTAAGTIILEFLVDRRAELRDKAGSDPSSVIVGLLPAATRVKANARTVDSRWVRIETPDGVVGWIDGAATGLKTNELEQLPVATTLTRLTDTPTPPATQNTSLTNNSEAVAELFRRTNELRLNNKLSPYTLNADLNQVALAHSQDMASRDELTDIGADGSTAVQRITNTGYGAGQPSEAICSGPGETVDSAWGKLTADSADLANLLSAVNTDIGIGVAEGKSNTYYTIVFGKPAQALTPTPAPLQGFGTPNGLDGQVLGAGSIQDRISFELVVFDPDAGKSNGAGITSVDMSVVDPSGATVFTRTENNPRYCAFGGGEPDCTIWNFSEHGDAWPAGTPVCAGDGYQALMTVNATDAKKDGATWGFTFSITGKYPACQPAQ